MYVRAVKRFSYPNAECLIEYSNNHKLDIEFIIYSGKSRLIIYFFVAHEEKKKRETE